jgi:RsiW-degrading membrane proteinase PrsW (M82 family)
VIIPGLQTLVTAGLLAIVPTIAYFVILNAIDRYEKQPWMILLACIGLGAIVAPLVSAGLLAVSGRPFALPPSFASGPTGAYRFVAVIEEVVKGGLLLVLVMYVRDQFDDVLDGIIYGAAVGAGFGAAETFAYVSGGVDLLPAPTILALLVSGLNHALYTAVFGGIVGYARALPDRNVRFLVVGLGLATAVLLHAFHDALPAIMSRVLVRPDATVGLVTRIIANLINLLGLLTLAVAIIWALRRETRVLEEQLGPEVENGVISHADSETISSVRARLARQLALLRSRGLGPTRTLRALYAAEGELAFQKLRLEVRSRKRPEEARTEALRDEVRRLRRALEEPT